MNESSGSIHEGYDRNGDVALENEADSDGEVETASSSSTKDEPLERRMSSKRRKKKRLYFSEKMYECKWCRKKFPYQSVLQAHERRHTGEKPFVCGACGKAFAQKAALTIHERRHSGDKPFACGYCGKRFATNGAMKTHEVSHTDEKIYSCDICQRTFAHRTSLYTHKKKHELGIFNDDGTPVNDNRRRRPSSSDNGLAYLGASPTFSEFDASPLISPASGLHLRQMNAMNGDCGVDALSVKIEPGLVGCAAGFGSNELLLRPASKRWECEFCGKRFAFKHPLQTHLRTHTGEKPFKCSYCPKAFAQQTSLIMHHRSHTGERRYGCEICGRRFIQPAALKAHQRTHTGEKPFNCKYCDKAFAHATSLRTHHAYHERAIEQGSDGSLTDQSSAPTPSPGRRCRGRLPSDKQLHSCFCGRTFPFLSLLENHMRTHTGEKPFSCPFCDKRFRQKATLQVHERTHTGERPYKCRYCDRMFAQIGTKSVHERSHFGIRSHKCAVCGKLLSSPSALYTHRKTHGAKVFQCHLCSKSFSVPNYLKLHMKTVHCGVKKTHQCKYCGKFFSYAGSLQVHIRSHTGEKPFRCRFCPKAFASQGNLQSHERTHTGERPYMCSECGRAFAQRSQLTAHEMVHAKQLLLASPNSADTAANNIAIKSNVDLSTTVGSGGPIDFSFGSGRLMPSIVLEPLNIKEEPVEENGELVSMMLNNCGADSVNSSSKSNNETEPSESASKLFSTFTNGNAEQLLVPENHKSDSFQPMLRSLTRFPSTPTSLPSSAMTKVEGQASTSEGSVTGRKSADAACGPDLDCKYCGKRFSYASSLYVHTRLHTGERPFKCQFCPKTFTNQGNMQVHERVHTGEKPYRCHACQKGYAQKVGLNIHLEQCPAVQAMRSSAAIMSANSAAAMTFLAAATQREQEGRSASLRTPMDALEASSMHGFTLQQEPSAGAGLGDRDDLAGPSFEDLNNAHRELLSRSGFLIPSTFQSSAASTIPSTQSGLLDQTGSVVLSPQGVILPAGSVAKNLVDEPLPPPTARKRGRPRGRRSLSSSRTQSDSEFLGRVKQEPLNSPEHTNYMDQINFLKSQFSLGCEPNFENGTGKIEDEHTSVPSSSCDRRLRHSAKSLDGNNACTSSPNSHANINSHGVADLLLSPRQQRQQDLATALISQANNCPIPSLPPCLAQPPPCVGDAGSTEAVANSLFAAAKYGLPPMSSAALCSNIPATPFSDPLFSLQSNGLTSVAGTGSGERPPGPSFLTSVAHLGGFSNGQLAAMAESTLFLASSASAAAQRTGLHPRDLLAAAAATFPDPRPVPIIGLDGSIPAVNFGEVLKNMMVNYGLSTNSLRDSPTSAHLGHIDRANSVCSEALKQMGSSNVSHAVSDNICPSDVNLGSCSTAVAGLTPPNQFATSSGVGFIHDSQFNAEFDQNLVVDSQIAPAENWTAGSIADSKNVTMGGVIDTNEISTSVPGISTAYSEISNTFDLSSLTGSNDRDVPASNGGKSGVTAESGFADFKPNLQMMESMLFLHNRRENVSP